MRRSVGGCAGLVVAAALLALPAAAPARNVVASDSTLTITSGPSDAAPVTVEYVQATGVDADGNYAQRIDVSSAPDAIGNGSPSRCDLVTAFKISCRLAHYSGPLDPGTAPVLTADVPFSLTLTGSNELGAGAARPMTGTITTLGGTVLLGGGVKDDVGAFTVDASSGSSGVSIGSGPANDTLKGGSGNDGFFLRSGDMDAVTGGGGTDQANYANAAAGVTARIGGAAGDDALATDIETLVGSDFADTLIGDDSPNRIMSTNRSFAATDSGVAGDMIDGRGGDDLISAITPPAFTQSAATIVRAGGGNDSVIAGGGSNELYGETGNDQLLAAFGSAIVDGDLGDDQIFASSHLSPAGGNDDLRGGGGVDTVSYLAQTVTPVTVDLQAGSGGPTGSAAGQLDALSGFENATGDGGADVLIGDGGANVLRGEGGDDRLVGAAGADALNGGEGRDDADYTQAAAALSVTLDDVANDGASGEGDDVQRTIEVVEGGALSDTITGDDSDERLIGNGGDDTIDGGLGADEIVGGAGSDTVDYSKRTAVVTIDLEPGPVPPPDDGAVNEGDALSIDIERVLGGSADDTLIGGAGAQSLFGGGGNDLLVGGPDADLLVGDDGDDTLASADAAEDRDRCGAGSDTVAADTLDVVDPDCEVVTRAAVAPSGGGAPGGSAATTPPPAFFTISISAQTVTLTTRGVAGIPVSCPARAAGGCQGIIVLQTAAGVPVVVVAAKPKRRIVTLGRASYDIPAGRKRTVAIRLSKTNQRLLRKLGRVKVRATIRPRAGASTQRTFTLKASARRRAR